MSGEELKSSSCQSVLSGSTTTSTSSPAQSKSPTRSKSPTHPASPLRLIFLVNLLFESDGECTHTSITWFSWNKFIISTDILFLY